MIAKLLQARTEAHAAYLLEEKVIDEAISEMDFATRAMRDSKPETTDGELDPVQLRSMATTVLQAARSSKVLQATDAQLTAYRLSTAVKALLGNKQEITAYEFQSNDIVAMLDSMTVLFKENKKELQAAELKTNSEHLLMIQKLIDEKVAESQQLLTCPHFYIGEEQPATAPKGSWYEITEKDDDVFVNSTLARPQRGCSSSATESL